MNSTALSMISVPRMFRNLGMSVTGFISESSGSFSGVPSGLSSERKNRISEILHTNQKRGLGM